ncbi:MAG: ComEA family DNA-binding protein [Planctomycetota bacterium]
MPKRRIRPSLALAILLAIPLFGPVSIPRPTRAPWEALRPDLNHAPAARIRLIPGIGPVRARAIVEERRRGRFRSHAELAERVPGIGPALARRLAEFSSLGR